MVFVTAPAVWHCRDDSRLSTNMNNTGDAYSKTFGQVCNNQNGSLCSKFEFETSEINTVATEVMILFRLLQVTLEDTLKKSYKEATFKLIFCF